MICVIATIEIAKDKRKDFLAEFSKVVPLVRAEKGCIEYSPMVELATSIPLQPPVRDDVVTVVEKWESVADLEAHLVAPHMNDYRKAVEHLVVGVGLQILAPAEAGG